MFTSRSVYEPSYLALHVQQRCILVGGWRTMSSVIFPSLRLALSSFLELRDLPRRLRPFLDGVHDVQGFKLTLGHTSGAKKYYVVVPQNGDYRLFVIDNYPDDGGGISGDILLGVAKQQYPELEDGSLKYLEEIGVDKEG